MDDEWTLGGALGGLRSSLAGWRDETFGPIRSSLDSAKRAAMGSLYRPDRYGRDDERARERDDPAAEVRAAMAQAVPQDPAKREAMRQSFSYAQRRPMFNPNPVAPQATMGGPMGFQGGYDPFQRRPV